MRRGKPGAAPVQGCAGLSDDYDGSADLDDTLLGNPTQQFIERYFAALNGHLNETLHEPMMRAVRAVMERGDPALTNSERF